MSRSSRGRLKKDDTVVSWCCAAGKTSFAVNDMALLLVLDCHSQLQ